MELLGILILRLTLGLIFVFHGLHQYLGWFGGGTMETVMKGLGLRPARLWSSLCGLGNLVGGAMVALGVFTFLGCALIITNMGVAMITIKGRNGFWERDAGYEYNLFVIGTAWAVALMGPGSLSVDWALWPVLIQPKLFYLALLISLVIAGLGLLLRTSPAPE